MRSPAAPTPVAEVLLDPLAARSCPVKTQNAHLPGAVRPPRPLDPGTVNRRAAATERRRALLDAWVAAVPGAVDLRRESTDRIAPTVAALTAGAPLVVGALLPPDRVGHRVGGPDVLVRAVDHQGRPTYHPVIVVGHHIITSDPPPTDRPRAEPRSSEVEETGPRLPTQAMPYGTLADPAPDSTRTLPGRRLKTGSRTGDFLQLAHHVRLLAAAGFGSPGPAWGGVIGTDAPSEIPGRQPEPLVGWLDLTDPVPTFGRPWPGPVPTFLEKYDQEHWFRLAIAEVARRQTGEPDERPELLVAPIVNPECATCPWWTACRSQLDDDDLGLRIERGRLRPLEMLALRALGVGTVGALAEADLDPLLDQVASRVGERPGAESRVRTVARRARMLVDDQDFARETSGPITVATADREIDFDLETAADGHIYLWGFRVQEDDTSRTRQFVRFDDLDDAGELDLAREALGWLKRQVETAQTRVYHYSGFEVAKLRELAERSGDDLLAWAAQYAEREFVDLLEVTKTHYFGVSGLGLKAIARHAGFRWRDPDPGGLNSQGWFDEAVHGPPEHRPSARRRVLEYNEDDVIATSRLRSFLRAQ